MKAAMNKKLLSFLVLAVAFTCTAYIYPTDFLLGQASEVWVQRPSMQVSSDIVVYGDDGVTLKATGKARYLWDRQSDLRVDYTTGDTKETVIYKQNGERTTNPATLSGNRHHLIHELFAALNSGDRTENLVKKLGISRKDSAFARYQDQVCYVFGAGDGQDDVPQLWIDKDNKWPVRLMVFHGKERIELRFSQWDHPLMKGLFPHRMELYINNRLREVQTVAEIETFIPIDPALFAKP